MAHFHLSLRNNKRAFARCYEELVAHFNTVNSYLFLGEAYMNIHDPHKAVSAYQKAHEMDPEDAEISSKIGKALVATHDYNKAIKYYKDATVQNPECMVFRHDLAQLLWRLTRYDEAEVVLQETMQFKQQQTEEQEYEELSSIQDKVKTSLLLAKVHHSSGNIKAAMEDFIQARVFQQAVLSKVRGESPEMQAQQRRLASDISFELGNLAEEGHQPEKAIESYSEALRQAISARALPLCLQAFASRLDISIV